MSIVAKKKLLFLLADEAGLTYYVDSGIVKKSNVPYWVKHSPDGWKDITLQFATNQKYFSTLRTFSNAVRFVQDGEQIILDRTMNGAGSEEIMYLIILKNDPSKGLNYYGLEYKSRLDFSKFNGDPRKGIAMNTLQDDVFAMVQANETASYSIPCNSSNPAAIKVLYDGVLLQDKLNYDILSVPIELISGNGWFAVPITFTNNEGDSVGVIFNSQGYDNFSDPHVYVTDPINSNYLVSFITPNSVRITGTYTFNWSTNSLPSGQFTIAFMTSADVHPVTYFVPLSQVIFSNGPKDGTQTPFDLVAGQTYSVNFDITLALAANEKVFLICNIADNPARHMTITAEVTLTSISFSTKQIPSIAYGLRPLDYLQQLVSVITNGKFKADSNFFRSNNRKIVTSGSALRSFPDAQIQSTFADFFKSYSAAYNLGVTVREGVLFVEPIEAIYNSNKELLNFGQISEVTLNFAEAYMFTSGKFGYIKQTYNKRNGRYEYNCTHNYKFPIHTVLNQMDKVSTYRADCFGMEFIRTGYPDQNSTDDKGDHDVFTVMISDEIGHTDGNISTAIAVTIEVSILAAPIIKHPYSSTTVYSTNPTIIGTSQPLKIITIYVDGIIDGTTTADMNGDWTYTITRVLPALSTVFNGVHFISANAQTDPSNISGFSNIISLTINTVVSLNFLFLAPTNGDSLYNNLPLIEGIAPPGSPVSIYVDGGLIGSVVANNSGYWFFQTVAALSNAAHILRASSPGLPDAIVNVTVNSSVFTPLITSLKYGDLIFDNLPLIKGVAIPGTVVSIFLDGGGGPIGPGPSPMGTATADANGDWSFQVVSIVDSSGLTLDHIPDGLHIFSTTATPINVLAAISGYKLMRGTNKGSVMDYDAIRLDDQYIPPGVDPATLPPTLGKFLHPETLYNIEETSPLRMMEAHKNLFGSFLVHQPNEEIVFNGAEINANLVTKKGTTIFNEGANIKIADIPKPPLFLPWMLNFKSRIPKTFNEIMTSINNDGYITTQYLGTTIYCLPVGTMSTKPATDEAQQLKLLVSGKTPLLSLIKLFSKGLFINLGPNMIYTSIHNPLHFVKYNYTPPANYHFKDIYDDWQKNRFDGWLAQPDYVQPFQKTDPIPLQVISNGVSGMQIQLYSATKATLITTIGFTAVAGAVVALPNILQECSLDMSIYPEDDYWAVLFADGSIVGISEKFTTQTDWAKTYLLEYGGSEDQIDFYFSSGIKPAIRFEGLLTPWMPNSESDIYEDEYADPVITRGVHSKKRTLFFGNGQNLLPDWQIDKIDAVTLLTNWRIEGTQYSRTKESKIEPVEQGQGFPNYPYKMEVALADNRTGTTFTTPGDSSIHTTLYVLDAIAFGQQPGVINVTAPES